MKQADSNTANRRAADQVRTLPPEMRCPFVAAGIEQEEKNLAIYRDLALADVSAEYEEAMRSFPVR